MASLNHMQSGKHKVKGSAGNVEPKDHKPSAEERIKRKAKTRAAAKAKKRQRAGE